MRSSFDRLLIIFFIVLSFLNSHAQKNEKLEIYGSFNWLIAGEKVLLKVQTGGYGIYPKLDFDSAVVKDGKFYLSGKVPDGPRLFFLYFLNHPTRFIHLFVGNEKIKLEDDGKDLPQEGFISQYIKISGSQTANAFINAFPLEHIQTYFFNGVSSYISKIEDSIGYNRMLIEATLNMKEKMIKSSLFELAQLSKLPGYNAWIPAYVFDHYRLVGKESSLIDLYNLLSEKTKNSYYGKIMKGYISSCIDQTAPDFAAISQDGKSIQLKDIASKSKMTILYFWSPTPMLYAKEKMNAELSNLYRLYRDKGLNIVSVYTGTDSLRWKKDIDFDHLPWYQAADFKGPSNGISRAYGFTTEVAPFTILIDQNGKIGDWLAEGAILKYYLDKTLGE